MPRGLPHSQGRLPCDFTPRVHPRSIVGLGKQIFPICLISQLSFGMPLTPKTQSQLRSSSISGEITQKPTENLLFPKSKSAQVGQDGSSDSSAGSTAEVSQIYRRETTLTYDHPTVTSRPFDAALIFHSSIAASRSVGDPWFKDSSIKTNSYTSATWLGGLSLTPYVPEGIPPATLRIDASGRAHSFGKILLQTQNQGTQGKVAPADQGGSLVFLDPREQARHMVLRSQIRMHLGLRDLNLSSQKSPDQKDIRAFSLALPDGLIVAEITAWSRRRVVRPEAAVGYRMISRQGFEVDVLLPKHFIFGYRASISLPKFYILGQKSSRYQVPVIAELLDSDDPIAPLEFKENPRNSSDPRSFSLEKEEQTQFIFGVQQKIFHIWHVSLEIGLARTQWTLYRSSGQEYGSQSTGFGPYGAISIESLVPSFVDRGLN